MNDARQLHSYGCAHHIAAKRRSRGELSMPRTAAVEMLLAAEVPGCTRTSSGHRQQNPALGKQDESPDVDDA